MKELRSAFRVLWIAVRLIGWVLETVWLGARAVWRLSVLAARWKTVLAEARECPRHHRTAMYGVFECRCGALVEDWVFARCRVCGQSAGWTPCTTCGLPIRNPLLP